MLPPPAYCLDCPNMSRHVLYLLSGLWIPAFAGMAGSFATPARYFIVWVSIRAPDGPMGSGFRRNEGAG